MASIMVTPVQSNNLKNYAKFNLTQPKLSVRVSSTHYEPYMYRNEKGEFVNGIEYKLLEVIAQKESLRLFFQNQPDPLNNDDFISSSFDIMVGGIFPNSTLTATLAASKPYHQDELTWCIQRAKYFPSVIRIFMVATPECWILAIFGIGYLSGFIIYLMIQFDLKYKHRNRRDWHYAQWLIAVPAVLTMNQRFQPFYAPLRMYYVLLLIFSVFLWQIVFFHAVRFYKFPVQREQIKTVNEIVDDGFRLAGSADVLHLITFDPQYKKSQIDSFFVCSNINSCLEHLKHYDNSDLAIAASRQHIRPFSPSKFYCFGEAERIAGYQPTLLMRKDFPLKSRINEIIQNAFESGLFVKWARDSQRKKERAFPYEASVQLTMEDLLFLFVFHYGIGCILSMLSLIAEVIIHRKMHQAKRSTVWKYLEQFFDSQRYYLKNLPEKFKQNANWRNIVFSKK